MREVITIISFFGGRGMAKTDNGETVSVSRGNFVFERSASRARPGMQYYASILNGVAYNIREED